MTERRAVIKSADMSEDMQQDAVDCTSMALEKYNIEKVSERLLRHTTLDLFLASILIHCPHLCLPFFPSTQDIAAYIKKEFDKKYNPTWHCVVGRNFGSYVTHETKHFIYFYLGQVAILLFKSG
jgi:dynein light chain LC8-type